MQTGYHETVPNDDGLYCCNCNVPLVSGKVTMTYLRSTFPTQLLKCPECGAVYISEELAVTKAVEVEKSIEEK